MPKFIDNSLNQAAQTKLIPEMSFELHFFQCTENTQSAVNELVAQLKTGSALISVQTSGSTGTPKSIEFQQHQLIASAQRTNAFFGLSAHSTVVLPLSVHRIAGIMSIVRAFIGNYALCITEPSVNFLHALPEGKTFDLVSCSINQLDELLNQHALKRFKQVLLGGSAISSQLENTANASQVPIYLGYGMTETVSHIALRKLGEPLYFPLTGVEISSTDAGTKITDHETGITNLWCTDVLNIHENNGFEFIGRTDFAIVSGGIKIHPEPLEKELEKVFNVTVYISSIPDERLMEKVIAVSENEFSEAEIKAMNEHISKHFGKYAVPKQWIVHSVPMLNELKMDRKALKTQLNK